MQDRHLRHSVPGGYPEATHAGRAESSRSLVRAGGAQLRLKSNTGSTATGGTGQTPTPKNLRGNPSAQSIWANDGATITNGTTLTTRLSVGFAQTGGMGGYVPIVPTAAIQMMPNATNPIDVEVTSDAATASVTFDATIDIGEGI